MSSSLKSPALGKTLGMAGVWPLLLSLEISIVSRP